MHKKKIISLLLIFFLFSSWVRALSVKQKGAILENFKKSQYELLFETQTSEIDKEDASIFNISKKINIFWNIKDKISTEREKLENKKENVAARILSLEESIQLLDDDIQEATDKVNKVNAKIISIKKEVWGSKKTIELLRKKIYENRKVLLKYLVYIYKKWNNVYGETEVDNLKTILLNEENISDILNDLYFKWIIEVTGKKLIDKHRKFVSELYIKKIDLEKQEMKLKQVRKFGIIDRKILNDKKDFKERIIKVSKWRQALYERYIYDKLKVEKAVKLRTFKEKIKFNNVKQKLLEKYGCRFVDLWKDTLEWASLKWKCLELNKVIYAESKLKWFWVVWKNIFSWPVSPKLWISSYYHDSEYEELFWSTHDAIDIVQNQWTDIKAPADWYVTFIQKPTSGEYSSFALKHSDGYLTVYGHVNEVFINEFDFVRKWQVIWKTGWEFGTKWAWLMTTWPHLHFEVFKDEAYVDPLSVMNISFIQFDRLPQKYRFKYSVDFKERKWYTYVERAKNSKVFKLDWLSEVERQQSLIDKYAVWAFRNWDMWVEESLDGNIDPTFVMCIWLAESWLWLHLKTPYNVWNIWNTDSGAVKAFPNARSWVYWMIKTLNNKYLWKYNEIKDLSRYWNKTWSIYASSPDHWHNNIITCMGSIKWVYVPDNYNYRIMK